MINRRTMLLGAPAIAAGLAGCDTSPNRVLIGVAHPMSGPLAALGADTLNGVNLAVRELNQEGIKVDGRTTVLEVVSVDDKADPEVGKQVARKLVEQKVAAVVGHLNSGVSMAAAPFYANALIPQLAMSTKPEYTQMGLPTTLRLLANDTIQALALASFAAEQTDGQAFALVGDTTPYGQGLAEAATRELRKRDKKIVLTRMVDNKTVDFGAMMPELKATKTDVIVTTLGDFQVAAMIEQLAAAGLTHMRIVGADPLKTDKLIAGPLPIKAVYATSPIVDVREFLQGPAFLSRFRAAFNGDPIYGAHYAYDAIYVLVAAMRRCGAVTGDKLLHELKHIAALAPVTNMLRFNEQGEQYHSIISIYSARPGSWDVVSRSDRW